MMLSSVRVTALTWPLKPRKPRRSLPVNSPAVFALSAAWVKAAWVPVYLAEQIAVGNRPVALKVLMKIIGGEAVGGILAAGPLIAGGHPEFLAAAAAGVMALAGSTLRHRSFPDRFPAAFFMKVQSNDA